MADEKAVETGTEAAGATVVEKTEGDATTTQDLNLAETLEKTLEQLAKTEEERENYKRGMLKAKGKDGEGDDEDSLEDRIAARLEAKLLDKESDAEKKKAAELTQKLIKRNKEMEEALKNKSQIGGGTGAGSESPLRVGDNMLSEAQVADLKGRGWDDAKITRLKQNLLKIH